MFLHINEQLINISHISNIWQNGNAIYLLSAYAKESEIPFIFSCESSEDAKKLYLDVLERIKKANMFVISDQKKYRM